MKKRISGYKLNMDSSARLALMKNLVSELVRHEAIVTTKTKAKAVTPIFEKILTRAKVDTIQNRRMVQAYIQNPELVKKLFESIAPRYKTVRGGYTKLLVIGNRLGDNASTAKLILTKKLSLDEAKEIKKSEPKKLVKTKPVKKTQEIAPEKTKATKAAPKIVTRTGKRGDK